MNKLSIRSYDGVKIAFDHYRKAGRESVIIICHGFMAGKSIKPFPQMAAKFFKKLDVISMDQRGHGESGGFFTFSAREHLDIKAVVDFAAGIYNDITLIGFSLGAASSIIEAVKYHNVARLILVSPPAQFEKIENRWLDRESIRNNFKRFDPMVLKFRPGNVLLKKIRPVDAISKLNVPVLIMHGKRDRIIFSKHAEEVYLKATEPKKLVMFNDGTHAENLFGVFRRVYQELSGLDEEVVVF